MKKSILVTGTAGFIGFHLAKRLVENGHSVVGYDIINDYYDVNLKYSRLSETGIDKNDLEEYKAVKSSKYENYTFIKGDLANREGLAGVFRNFNIEYVVNLAAQAGVRYSIENPAVYIESNIAGFSNLVELCRQNKVKHLVYASSSSVYGLNESMPFSTSDNVDHPISLYAASKKSNELIAHTYSHLFGLPTTGLRFFTVYGPWGRPDMALFIFTKAILEGKAIQVNNNGNMQRDFTYVDDIVESLVRLLDLPPAPDRNWSGKDPDPSSSPGPYRIYNIGNSSPVQLMDFVEAIENELGKKAIKEFRPMQAGDVPATWADVEDLFKTIAYKPRTGINEGIKSFIAWYTEYFNSKH
ncbi:MAG: NAD-dependent epimerase [Marinilabiliaceae bacterium]|jgi:UDP-glucuronate 4-epimerase|nr:NAD-dependent epimerase [Marinilabiliaceae bacterium]